jgi:iron(III) transport system substrate-binding protein
MVFMRFCLSLFVVALFAGCSSRGEQRVIVYTALDREFSEPVLDGFTAATGIRALPKYDDESTKTVGLTSAIIAESGRPRCDVFWNNEILNTLRLVEWGLVEAYQSPSAASYPEMYRAGDGSWHGFAGRARILIVNTELVAEDARPTSIYDLADPKWKGQAGIARPVAGSTASHVACLFAALGDEAAQEYLTSLRANDVKILGGNKQVALAVAAGQIAFGLTDTDDAIVEIDRASPVAIVYPDRAEDQLGTLFIPNTLCIIRGGPNPEAARKLVDYLLSPAVEEQLARGASAQIPLNPEAAFTPRVETPRTVKAMEVDFAAAAAKWNAAAKFIEEEFLAAE